MISDDKERILILHRSPIDDVFPGYWDIPGGTLENGEDPAVGAIREVREETGLSVSDMRLFFHTSHVDFEKDTQFITLIFASHSADSRVICNSKEHDAYEWISPLDIGRYKAVDYLGDCLLAYQNYLPL